jgi:hypothetical protein
MYMQCIKQNYSTSVLYMYIYTHIYHLGGYKNPHYTHNRMQTPKIKLRSKFTKGRIYLGPIRYTEDGFAFQMEKNWHIVYSSYHITIV